MRLRRPGRNQVDPVARLHDYAHAQRRAGFLDEPALLDDVTTIAAEDVDAASALELARDAIAAADAAYEAEQTGWPAVTDYDRLQAAFGRLAERGLIVLQGVDDHWSAARALRERSDDGSVRGVAWFTRPDVWHAVDYAMLEVNVWHANTANVAPGDPLLDEVLAVFADHDLPAHFDEGRIEVTASWQRRL